MVLNPTDYLTSHGWSGPGSGFTATSRSKPITVLQKKNNFGVGKDRDTSHPWWDDVFTKIATKIGPAGGTENKEEQLDSEKKLGPTTCQATHQPPNSHEPPQNTISLNLEVIQAAKKSALRQEFYRRFLRGATIVGTTEDENKKKISEEKSTQIYDNDNQSMTDSKVKKRHRKLDMKEPEEELTKPKKKKKKSKSRSLVETNNSPSKSALEKLTVPEISVDSESIQPAIHLANDPSTTQSDSQDPTSLKRTKTYKKKQQLEEELNPPKKKKKSKSSLVDSLDAPSQAVLNKTTIAQASVDKTLIQSTADVGNHLSTQTDSQDSTSLKRTKTHKKKAKTRSTP